MAFMVFAGKFSNPVFIAKHSPTKVVLIVNGHPVHRSASVRDFVARHNDTLRLVTLPRYCTELNPDELLNQDVKTNALGKGRPTNRAELVGTVRAHLHRRQKQPHVVRNLFRETNVRYAP